MAQFHPAWLAHQRQRWRRHDWQRYVRPDADGSRANRYFRPQYAHLDREPVARKNAAVEADMTPEELAAYRSELLELKALVAELKWQLALWRFARKYRPDQLRDDHGRFADEGREKEPQAAIAGMPRIPSQRPPTGPERTAVAKAVARWLAEKGIAAAEVIAKTLWLYYALPTITSYLDSPKSLEELQQDASTSKAGYDRHHIVEQSSAEEDGYSRRRIDAADNLVRVPRMKHWDINAWYQTRNPDFQDMSPRDYLRHKDWDERRRVGIEALVRHGVLRP